MPANLTPAYLAAEARFRGANTTEEKLAALDEMYATIPKHKGTEKLRAGIKRRISKLREKGQQAPASGSLVAREGVGQIALVGPLGAGKTSIFAQLSGENFDSMAGLMEYEDVLIQLIDTPQEQLEQGISSLIKKADAVAVVLDLADDMLLDQFEEIQSAFSQAGMVLVGKHSPERDYHKSIATMPTLIIATKLDLPNASENLEALQDMCGDEFDILPISTKTGEGIEELPAELFELLGVIRVYARPKAGPYAVKIGSTVPDFAAAVNKDYARSLRQARIWRKNELDGLPVDFDFVLEDGDSVELLV